MKLLGDSWASLQRKLEMDSIMYPPGNLVPTSVRQLKTLLQELVVDPIELITCENGKAFQAYQHY